MEKSVQITLIVVAGILILGFMGIAMFSNFAPTNTVNVNGESSVDVVPDLVSVYFNVETKGTTSQEAKDKNSEIIEEVITSLIMQGFDRDEIQTQNFNIYPNYVWSGSTRNINGYVATHSLKVEMSSDDADKIGEVIDAGVDAGAGINYVAFELSQELQNEYKAEAIKLAAEDAKIKAEALAEGLDKRLGRLVSTSDSSFDYYPWRLYEASGVSEDVAMAKQATTNIQPGEQTISARVSAVFKIY